jgi:tetratricopeptide (TPR) repeat protein
VNQAERLRLACRWDDALELLAGREDVEARVERVRILTDKHTLAEDVGGELTGAIDELAGAAGGDPRVDSFVRTERGLKLHAEFLQDRSKGEPPDELRLFEEALELRRGYGDERKIAESLFHVGLVHQVIRGDTPTSEPFFRESYDRAKAAGDEMVMSYAVRHLGFAFLEAGDLDGAEEAMRESLELRKRTGWVAGIAAAESGVAAVSAARGRTTDAIELVESARSRLVEIRANRALRFADAQLEGLRAGRE